MSDFSLVLFDDGTAQGWEPFALTRPAGELLFGTETLRARLERMLQTSCSAYLAADHLEGFDEVGAPRVFRHDQAPDDGDRLFLLSRALLAPGAAGRVEGLGGSSAAVVVDGRTVGWFAPAGSPPPGREFLRDPNGAASPGGATRTLHLAGRVLERVWELVLANPDQVADDIRDRFPAHRPAQLPPGVHRIGDGIVVVGSGARIEPGVVLDTRGGPIWLDEGAEVRAFTRLAGPAYVGRGSRLLGGPIEAVSIGPVCRVRGELAESICLGYTNKQHDGHIGHAYLGRWVNLGAETTNSDLKNNYGTIRVWTPAGETDTGMIKLGSLIGDHVKTGIGLLLNTGTVIGAGSNLYGAAMPPRFVPPFSWGSGVELTEYRADKFLDVAERAMSRRDVALSPAMRAVLERGWQRSRALRENGE
jgi:UDP-N-acetylglucosamine diphosphorylase / glucose-1-phosphate thymidylyltransferase / UDP-N-acetylgalactosamine diphosphorylase / glucosamine-1-phosphate N-acetyltransferase / galactosamine-1-phosphate N-acetyltransferase